MENNKNEYMPIIYNIYNVRCVYVATAANRLVQSWGDIVTSDYIHFDEIRKN